MAQTTNTTTDKTTNKTRPEAGVTRDLYDLVTGDEDARVCRDIPDASCRAQPGNFFVHLCALIGNKSGDLLASPKLVLPWLIAAIGGPAWAVGLLVPLREALALLPQLVVARWMRAHPRRKWFWAGGAVIQGTSVLLMAVAVLVMAAWAASMAILVLLAVFSLGRGVCSVAYKDVQGKTIAKTRRGTLSGLAASCAGGVAIVMGAVLWWLPVTRADIGPALLLLALAGVLWLAAGAIFAALREYSGATDGGGNALTTAWRSFGLLATKPGLARFIAVRGLLIASALAAPYYVALAHDSGRGQIDGLALLLALSGLASLVSAPVWGRLADQSSRFVLVITGLLVAGLNALIAVASVLGAGHAFGVWPFAIGYFLLAGLHAGVQLGRKTYLTDLGNTDDRAQLTAVTNTSIGIILLAGGGVIAAIASAGPTVAIAVLAVPPLAAAWLARGLPETE